MIQININDEKNRLISFSQQPDFDEYVKIFLIKIKKNEIFLYKQDADKKTKENILKAIIESMNKSTFSNREIKPYDPVITYKNVHEQVEVSEYENIQSVISQFNDEQQHLLSTSCETEKDLHNYLIEIKKNSTINLKFIGSFVNAFQLEKKMLFGNFTDSKIKLRERNNLFGLNKKIDLMIVNDEKILINQAESKFDSIFGMNQKFAEQATEILNTDVNIKTIIKLWKLFKFDGKESIKIPRKMEISPESDSLMNYIVTYFTPLLSFDMNNTTSIIMNLLLFLLIGLMYVGSNASYLNPVLGVFGFKIFGVTGFPHAHHIITNLSFDDIETARETDVELTSYRLGDGIYILKRK